MLEMSENKVLISFKKNSYNLFLHQLEKVVNKLLVLSLLKQNLGPFSVKNKSKFLLILLFLFFDSLIQKVKPCKRALKPYFL